MDLPTFGKPTIPIDKLMIAIIAKYLRFIDDWVTISIMKNRVILFISIPAAVLFICVGLILSGYLYVGIKNPSQGVVLSSAQSACGQSRVDEFKKIIDSSSGYDQKSFDGIVSDIKSKAGYEFFTKISFRSAREAKTHAGTNKKTTTCRFSLPKVRKQFMASI